MISSSFINNDDDDPLLSFLYTQQHCIKGSVAEFYSWLISSEDIDTIYALKEAVADDSYLNETLKVGNGNGNCGLKGFKRKAFKKAVLEYTSPTVVADYVAEEERHEQPAPIPIVTHTNLESIDIGDTDQIVEEHASPVHLNNMDISNDEGMWDESSFPLATFNASEEEEDDHTEQIEITRSNDGSTLVSPPGDTSPILVPDEGSEEDKSLNPIITNAYEYRMELNRISAQLINNMAAVEEDGIEIRYNNNRFAHEQYDQHDVILPPVFNPNGNADAFYNLAGCYANGTKDMPQNLLMANELFLKAGELGHAEAYFNLGNAYVIGRGVEVDKKKAKHYWELAAMNGNIGARYNLGAWEENTGNTHQAMKHFILAARAGHKQSLDAVKEGYKHGHITKDEYANTLRAHQKSHDEMKSEARDKAEAKRKRQSSTATPTNNNRKRKSWRYAVGLVSLLSALVIIAIGMSLTFSNNNNSNVASANGYIDYLEDCAGPNESSGKSGKESILSSSKAGKEEILKRRELRGDGIKINRRMASTKSTKDEPAAKVRVQFSSGNLFISHRLV